MLFRGKRKDNGEWIEGYFEKYTDGSTHILVSAERKKTSEYDGKPFYCVHAEKYEVFPESLSMQTGQKDKNKKEIFGSIPIDDKGTMSKGGDIVRIDNNLANKDCRNWLDNPNIKVVIKVNTWQSSWDFFGKYGEIIGNQYEEAVK